MELSAGQMALLNVKFLVADEETAFQYLFVGLPVLRHPVIDSRTLLEHNWSTIKSTDCSSAGNTSHEGPSGHVGCLSISRLQGRIREHDTKHDPQRPRSNYFANQQDTEPFPDTFLIQPENYE